MEEIRNFTDIAIWSIEDIVDSFSDKPKNKNKITVPKYQRNLVWSDDKKKSFIQSLKSGFPVGAILLSKSNIRNNIIEYSVIDGLQRTTTLKEYNNKPTEFFDKNSIDDDLLLKIKKVLIVNVEKEHIQNIIATWIQNLKGFSESDGFSSYSLATVIAHQLNIKMDHNVLDTLIKELIPFAERIKKESNISNIKIPIILYSGDSGHLPTIFENLNSKGIKLSKYQVFAAAWDHYKTKIHNPVIIKLIQARYEALINQGLQIEDYDATKFSNQEFSVFEYFFGLSKHICNKFDDLFNNTKKEEENESIAFNIASICLSALDIKHPNSFKDKLSLKSMGSLPDIYLIVDPIKFEDAIMSSIDFVSKVLKPYISLRANQNGTKESVPIYHTEFQIVSIIGKVFHSKYNQDLSIKKTWAQHSKKLEKSIPSHYLYDIINDNWRGSGDTRATKYAVNDEYDSPISFHSWESTLNDWLESELKKKEKRRNLDGTNILFLKYIYTHLLTAREELSPTLLFEIEHLTPVARLKPILDKHKDGIPIGAISNLCLIERDPNRKKGDLTFYEYYDKLAESAKLQKPEIDVKLAEIEKYTFTQKEDLEFIKSEKTLTLGNYNEFLRNRFAILKQAFYELNDIKSD